MTIDLEEAEWNAVVAAMTFAPWRDVNPLLMKIHTQINAEQVRRLATGAGPGQGILRDNPRLKDAMDGSMKRD